MSELNKRFFHVAVVWATYKLVSIATLTWSIITLVSVKPEIVDTVKWQWWGFGGTAIFLVVCSIAYLIDGHKIDKEKKRE